MRMSELSRLSGVSVTTIKYYLREGLLPPGRQLSATQAEYDGNHLRRLRLIRALTGVRGLSVSTAREVLGALAEHTGDTHRRARSHPRFDRARRGLREDSAERAEVEALIGGVRAGMSTRRRPRGRLWPDSGARCAAWACRSTRVAPCRTPGWPTRPRSTSTSCSGIDDPLELAERALLLTVLLEPALMALRRMAQENESARRHGRSPMTDGCSRADGRRWTDRVVRVALTGGVDQAVVAINAGLPGDKSSRAFRPSWSRTVTPSCHGHHGRQMHGPREVRVGGAGQGLRVARRPGPDRLPEGELVVRGAAAAACSAARPTSRAVKSQCSVSPDPQAGAPSPT